MKLDRFNLQIFVPSVLNSGAPAPPAPLEYVEHVLCSLGGGATITDALGVWTAPDGEVCREPVRIVETDALGTRAELRSELEALAQYIGRELGQIAVYVRIRETDAFAVTIDGNG